MCFKKKQAKPVATWCVTTPLCPLRFRATVMLHNSQLPPPPPPFACACAMVAISHPPPSSDPQQHPKFAPVSVNMPPLVGAEKASLPTPADGPACGKAAQSGAGGA